MTVFRHIEFVDEDEIDQFTTQTNPPFPAPICFYAIRRKRRIDVTEFGLPRSVLGMEIFYSNQKCDAPIVSCSYSPDGLKVICITDQQRGFLYDMKKSPTIPPVNFGPDILQACFLDDDNILFVNNLYEIFEAPVSDPNKRSKMSSIQPCTINVIEKYQQFIFYCTSIGIYLNSKRLTNTEAYACTCDGKNVYFLTLSGIIQYNLSTRQISTVFTRNQILAHLRQDSMVLSSSPLCYVSNINYLILCTKDKVLGFSLDKGTIGPIYKHSDEPLLGVAADGQDIFFVTSQNLHYLMFPKFKPRKEQVAGSDYINQLKTIVGIEDPLKQFTETSNLLQKHPDSHLQLIPLMVDSYCRLTPEQSVDIQPTLLHTLKKFRGIVSFDTFYDKLAQFARESEIWRFVMGFESLNEGLLLRTARSGSKMPVADVVFYLERCDPNDVNAAELCDMFPEIAHTVVKAVGDAAAPFILPRMNKLEYEALKSMKTGTGSIMDVRVCEKLGDKPKFVKNNAIFYLLDTAKTRNDWNEALQIAEELGIESEIKQCKTKIDSTEDIRAKLLKETLDLSEQTEVLMQLVNELEKAAPNKTYEDYSVFAKSIAKRIDSGIKSAHEKRGEEHQIIEELMRQKKAMRQQVVEVKEYDKCERCRKVLGKGKMIAFRCGHAFHPDCKKAIDAELAQLERRFKRTSMKVRGCPICGPQSSLRVFKNICKISHEWSLDF
ncbi:hypothetical protein TRFO_34514 [Tritrichomonas foetus]|uniref:RING-type domain-containing protein n=1 Tax=Tritrichomonas foetus TaxID=1144522 RepID=A0A1J4JIZ1_9EUKA|nr:hypothetical protein TRFO_34514 [Tritrichomonas foetus]|eukprot:OHS99114.1 hypothetical protein TRFO_34514 [Tritrichomonas foetus]